jgi:hypothetical protein
MRNIEPPSLRFLNLQALRLLRDFGLGHDSSFAFIEIWRRGAAVIRTKVVPGLCSGKETVLIA